MQEGTWWFIPRIVSRLLYIAGHKWEWVHPLITAVIPYLLSRMNHQVCLQFMAIFTGKRQRMDLGVVSFQTRMRCWGRLNSGWVIRTSLKFQMMYLTSTKTEMYGFDPLGG